MNRTRTSSAPAILTSLWDEAWDTRPGATHFIGLNERRRSPDYTGTLGPNYVHTNATPETEFISDEVTSEGRFKECYHTYNKQEFNHFRYPLRCHAKASTNYLCSRIGAGQIATLHSMMPVPAYDMDDLAGQAIAFMLPSINEGNSLVNFVEELKDLKTLDPRDALRRIKYGSVSFRDLSNKPYNKAIRSGFIKDTARRIASAHLQAEFGIIPFVKDIVDMYDQLLDLKTKVNRIKAHAGRPLTRHYKRVLPYADRKFWPKAHRESIVAAVGTIPYPFNDFYWGVTGPSGSSGTRDQLFSYTPYGVYAKQWVVRPTYHATMRYSYEIPQFDSEWGEKIAAVTESLGVRLDPSIPWNAARLSFLVDWVVDVSGFLRSFARENYPLKYKVLDFCHSLKWHSESTISITAACASQNSTTYTMPANWLNPDIYGSNSFTTVKPVFQAEVYREVDTHFERYRANPPVDQLAHKRASWRKAALAGSLLLTNARSIMKGRSQYLRLLPQSLRELRKTSELNKLRNVVLRPPSKDKK